MRIVLLAFVAVEVVAQQCCGGQEEFAKCDAGSCGIMGCIDCGWNDWSDWGPASCEGLCERHRTIAAASNACGTPCQGSRIETKRCTPECYEHPENCEFGEWRDWTICDSKCGGGQQYRERVIAKQSEDHGFPCEGVTKETRNCGGGECFSATDCRLTDWHSWGACSTTCSTGQQERTRLVSRHASHGGKPCDANLGEVRPCPDGQPCHQEKNCLWGQWGNWSACSQSCGGGERSRSRLIKEAPRSGGKLCEPLDMSVVEHCSTESCSEVVDCVLGPWTNWDACSCSCNGVQHRVRHIRIYPEEGGRPCSGPLREVKNCNTEVACEEVSDTARIDCELESWGKWEECSASCGTGCRVRQRGFLHHHHNGGKSCTGTLQYIEPCPDLPQCLKEETAVEIDCAWSPWDDWGACSASCNGGEKVRQRQVQQMPNMIGEPCRNQASVEVAACGMDPCGCSDCDWGAWSEWGACTCTGLRERHRNLKSHFHSCGHPCKGAKVVTESCHPHCLTPAKHCEFHEWSAWSQCSVTCEGGEAQRERSIKQASFHGGHACEGDLKEIRPCNQQRCGSPENCHVTDWSQWTSCTATCNGGQSFRDRRIKGEEVRGGHTCKAVLKEVRTCGTDDCGVAKDCLWGEWSEYSACSTHCGGGTKTRDRFIKVAPRLGGKLCDPIAKSEVAACNTDTCKEGCTDAQWTEWSVWSICSVSCGHGWHHRDRTTAQSANHCGKGLVGMRQDFMRCDLPCTHHAVDCQFSGWSSFGDCSCSCNGVRDRNRRIASFASNGGKNCEGPLKEIQSCNIGLCDVRVPVDCEQGDWEPWDDCSARCGGGHQFRSRRVLVAPKHEGRICDPPIKEVQGCNMHACTQDVDCKWEEWGDWGACTRECGGGEKSRYRRISVLPKHEGLECSRSDTMQVTQCNMQGCRGTWYCAFASWGGWSECSVTCGPGEKMRRRELQLGKKKGDNELLVDEFSQVLSVTFEDISSQQMMTVFFGGMSVSWIAFMVIIRLRTRLSRAVEPGLGEEYLLED
eukprot:GEMP01003715.1.p1 GENE.GEMP01003715.1~~GEMP01003715.1.p1  ORF type:complete len:1022 (+),score=243.68 GEMP01003715.1:188-3253(+)